MTSPTPIRPPTPPTPPTSITDATNTNAPTTNEISLAKWVVAMDTATMETTLHTNDDAARGSTSTRVLRLLPSHAHAAWLTSARASQTLFVRPCYEVLFVLATNFMACRQDEYHVILTGSHGVGKRSFLSYMLHRLRKRSTPPKIVLDLPVLFALIDCDGTIELGTRGSSFQAELCERETFYLCDAVDKERSPLCEGYLHAKSVVVMPPIKARETAFKPQPQRLQFTMPTWSFSELACCREVCYPHVSLQELQQRHEMWGGLVKWVLAEPLAVACTQFTRSLAQLTLDKAAEWARECGYVKNDDELTEGHYLIQLDVEPNDTFQLRAAFLCSLYACSELVDATLSKDQVIQFVHRHRATFRVQALVEQVESQLMRRLLLI